MPVSEEAASALLSRSGVVEVWPWRDGQTMKNILRRACNLPSGFSMHHTRQRQRAERRAGGNSGSITVLEWETEDPKQNLEMKPNIT
jgi:hypothetical protein